MTNNESVNDEYLEEEIPDELPESTGGWTYTAELVALGFVATPPWKTDAARSRGEKPPARMFKVAWKPLDFEFDTNPDPNGTSFFIYQQQGNLDVAYIKYLDKNGNIIGPNSPFGDIKAAFRELGYKLQGREDCALLIGKKFRVLVSGKKYIVPKKGEADDSRPVWTTKPIEELPADWTYVGAKKPARRRGYTNETAATRVDPEHEEADLEKLKSQLDGKAPGDFVMAIIGAGLEDPYITEAANNQGAALIARMTRAGMRFEGDRLVR